MRMLARGRSKPLGLSTEKLLISFSAKSKEILQREFGETRAGKTAQADLISWKHERTKRPEGPLEGGLKEVSVP